MPPLRRGLSGLVCLGAAVAASWAASAPLPDPFGAVATAYLVKVDGRELWGREPDRPLPPASLTKMMTALLVLERAELGAVVEVPRSAGLETGTRLGLSPGDRMPVIDLLAATVLGSANDACHALAAHVGGTEQHFVSSMNSRAAQLGLNRTRFANACGHDHPDLFSTARDLARLAEVVMANPTFAKMAGLVGGEVATADGARRFSVENKNELLGRYRGAKGVKTGFTSRAGKCLVAFAERDGTQVQLVLLNAPDRWWKAEEILDAAFAHHAPPAAGRGP